MNNEILVGNINIAALHMKNVKIIFSIFWLSGGIFQEIQVLSPPFYQEIEPKCPAIDIILVI